jgi:N-acetylglucosaminyldiphosphoundecaprenol N-acetyl-beta-D-mannosaminyltransferase
MTDSRCRILNIDVLDTTSGELLNHLSEGVLFTPNIDGFVLLQKDHDFYRAYKNADFVVLDSQVAHILFKLFRRQNIPKIAGSDFFPQYCEHHYQNTDIRIFVLGGIGNVAENVQAIVNAKAGRQLIVDGYSPGLDIEDNPSERDYIIKRIIDSGANVVAVGLGAPKQEKWIYFNRRKLPDVKIFMAVGASLDFMTGKQKRAPVWLRRAGLEWFFRLIQNPGRMAKRYLGRDLSFFYYFLLDSLNLYRDPYLTKNAPH